MISTLNLKNKIICVLLAALLLLAPLGNVFAQSGLSLSVSPTLFDMSAYPAQEWTSIVRVINPNPYDINVFADVVNFAPQGESGQGKFVPVIEEETKGQTMAEWVDIREGQITIPAEQTIELPFTITVPDDAPPGGHFAAVLIGTKPPEGSEGSKVITSQIVTTLLFLRVTGDIEESGNIRSFRTSNAIHDKPEVNFELRFENTGNVHIIPQGEIRITNMWGQERGLIPINQTNLFGNVLPESVRKYNFTWKSEQSFGDMGRYKAEVTLAYGEAGRKFAAQEVHFWVIPWQIILGVLIGLFIFVYIVSWAIRLYVRRMLSMAGLHADAGSPTPAASQTRRKVSVVAPIEADMLDLRGQWQSSPDISSKLGTIGRFIRNYRIFFLVLVLILVFILIVVSYIKSASQTSRPYDVTIDGLSEDVTITSEEVRYQELREGTSLPIAKDESLPKISIVNRSGVAGLAADVRLRLEQEGYEVVDVSNDLGAQEVNTVIVYSTEFSEQAAVLSQTLFGALTSAFDSLNEDDAPITVYVGRDIQNAVQ
tara:strand:- start:13312 stop:14931 length:1620 start_codon:yes stop_codon:yes gene_type:complete